MTPIWQGPLSAGAVGFALVFAAALVFDAGFLAAGLGAGVLVGAEVAGACAEAGTARQENTQAAAKIEPLNSRGCKIDVGTSF